MHKALVAGFRGIQHRLDILAPFVNGRQETSYYLPITSDVIGLASSVQEHIRGTTMPIVAIGGNDEEIDHGVRVLQFATRSHACVMIAAERAWSTMRRNFEEMPRTELRSTACRVPVAILVDMTGVDFVDFSEYFPKTLDMTLSGQGWAPETCKEIATFIESATNGKPPP